MSLWKPRPPDPTPEPKTITPAAAFYMGIAEDSFRPGERGEILTVITLTDEEDQVSAHFHVRYEDGFEYLAPIEKPERYRILGPKEKRVEAMKATFARLDRQEKVQKDEV